MKSHTALPHPSPLQQLDAARDRRNIEKLFLASIQRKYSHYPRNIKLRVIHITQSQEWCEYIYSFSGFLIVSRALYIPPDTNNNILWRKFLFKLFWRALAFFRKTYTYYIRAWNFRSCVTHCMPEISSREKPTPLKTNCTYRELFDPEGQTVWSRP